MDLTDTRTRTLAAFAAGAVTASLLAGVIVLDGAGDDDLSARLASDRTVMATPEAPVEIPAADAGTVTVDGTGDGLALVGAAPEAGWTVTRTRQEDDRVRVDFEQGTERVRVEVREDDGNLETRVDERDDQSTTSTTVADSTTSTTLDDDDDDVTTSTTIDDDATTPTTIDDHDDDDEDEEDDEDNSGPGSGDDDRDDRDDDDSSGPGGGDDD